MKRARELGNLKHYEPNAKRHAPNSISRRLELINASTIGDVEKVRSILSLDAEDLELWTTDLNSAIYIACNNGHCEIINLLIFYGINKGYYSYFEILDTLRWIAET